MSLPDADYQNRWRRALHGILLALAKRAGHGGMDRPELRDILADELHLDSKVVDDACDFLVRDKLISEERKAGLLGVADHHELLPAAVSLLAGAEGHKYIRFNTTPTIPRSARG